ncbi:MAG: VWA domain-containing protein [Pyrinomonadaceae bacterium]
MKVLAWAALLLLTGVAAAFAQKPTPTPRPTGTPIEEGTGSTKVFEVRLPVTVLQRGSDKKDHLVPGLSKNDFQVLEDGIPQEVTFFSDEKTNPPVYVGVLMDTSPSTAGKLEFEKEAAANFIYEVLQVRKDRAAFMTFDNEINLRQDFTESTGQIQKAIDTVKHTGSQTALYDAIWQFTDEKLRSVPGRKVIVVITDGDDTFSRADMNDVIDIAQRTETTIFAISTKGGFLGSVPGVEGGTSKDKGDKLLADLCESTGGSVFFPTNSSKDQMLNLERAFKGISDELKGQYIITYKPANQDMDGRVRKIDVHLTHADNAKQFKIHTKSSYRAVKDVLK